MDLQTIQAYDENSRRRRVTAVFSPAEVVFIYPSKCNCVVLTESSALLWTNIHPTFIHSHIKKLCAKCEPVTIDLLQLQLTLWWWRRRMQRSYPFHGLSLRGFHTTIKLYCLATEAHEREVNRSSRLLRSSARPGVEPAPSSSRVRCHIITPPIAS